MIGHGRGPGGSFFSDFKYFLMMNIRNKGVSRRKRENDIVFSKKPVVIYVLVYHFVHGRGWVFIRFFCWSTF
ncbi:hypothetical protein Hanom_Chr00s000002g01599631 [Helianthus anomalus]